MVLHMSFDDLIGWIIIGLFFLVIALFVLYCLICNYFKAVKEWIKKKFGKNGSDEDGKNKETSEHK